MAETSIVEIKILRMHYNLNLFLKYNAIFLAYLKLQFHKSISNKKAG